MEWVTGVLAAEDYEVGRQIVQRGVAAVYLIAFASALNQFPALLGERGLLPVPEYLRRAGDRAGPTLFRRGYTDRRLRAVAWTGIVLSALLVLGLPQAGPPWLPLVAFLVLWGLYTSIVNVGQVFYGFGWESLLLEAGFIVAFLGSDEVAPPFLVLIMIRWLVFRLEFGAGMIKMRGDRSWRDLTALDYHHETQPMPNPASRFFHLLPKPLHRVEVAGNHVTQLAVPWLLFAPQPLAGIAALVMILTQGWLVVSGNFAWLNTLTIILAFAAVPDSFYAAVVPAVDPAGSYQPTPLWFTIVVVLAVLVLAYLSRQALVNLFARHQLMNASFNRWHLGNAYGAFGSVTKVRYEVVVEGTLDDAGPDAHWREYGFKGKPGDPARRPRQFAPYHLRLDWMMWFLALGSERGWFTPFLVKLLQADPQTLGLLAEDPFDGARPRYVRARIFLYRFASRREKRETGLWWIREPQGVLVRPASLRAESP
ncbi:lipase maturation factor family protein [Arthrobacter bussei]|uniref:Lipase maturation factor family protein n=1 Tax=Arthrobacter bussei TaxID=2594179 RepID=A0A7X1NP66_9MICC|nr:lipase maturation factor family protein [Arthrobacter bussei]MPY10439.1 lipase maturation factor family protein [Arthrobacter bussei]